MPVLLAEPTTLRFGLEICHDEFTSHEPLVLNLWKGFSKNISFAVINQKPRPDGQASDWMWRLPVFSEDRIRGSTLGAQVHPARALSRRLLAIRDSLGTLVPIDGSADSDLWPGGGWVHDEPASREEYPLAYLSPSLLKQLRRKLTPGSEYVLQFAGETYQMELLPRVGDAYIHAGYPLKDEDKHLPSWRDQDQYRKTVTVDCVQNFLPFRVDAGTAIPRFHNSFISTSAKCSVSGNHGFSVVQTIESHAERPVKLALIKNSAWNSNLGHHNHVELAQNGFPHMTSLVPKQDAYRHVLWDSSAWTTGNTPHRDALMEVVPGAYRRGLLGSFHDSASNGVFWCDCTSFPFPTGVWQVVLCPGDRLVLRYSLEKEVLETLRSGGDYTLCLKRHCCQYWQYVDDSEVATPSDIAISKPSDLGILFFEPVSEVALTLKTIFERTRPMPFFGLPLELREMVYDGLRYGDDATWVHFRATA